jgi:hypothetical protein
MRQPHLQNRLLSNSKLRATCTGLACGSFLLSSLYGFAAGPARVTSGDGERKVIEQVSPPWGSVGQVNVGGYRRRVECTGSLIAANVVITAAHCVMDPINRKPSSPESGCAPPVYIMEPATPMTLYAQWIAQLLYAMKS